MSSRVALVAAAVVVVLSLRHHAQPRAVVRGDDGAGSRDTYTLDIDQAANSTTIAAVGKRLGLPDHAVTVALATALQESRLHNLPYGDRDSLGLFQQRPSQGWGTATEILTPSYAAAAFFRALTQSPNWADAPVHRRRAEGAAQRRAHRVRAVGAGGADARDRVDRREGSRAHVSLRARPFARPAPDVHDHHGQRARRRRRSTGRSRPGGVGRSRAGSSPTPSEYRVTTVSFRGHEWRASTGRWRSRRRRPTITSATCSRRRRPDDRSCVAERWSCGPMNAA